MQHLQKFGLLLTLILVLTACSAPTTTTQLLPPTTTSKPQVVPSLPPTPTATTLPTATPTQVKVVPGLFAPLVELPANLADCMSGQQFDRAISDVRLEGMTTCIEDSVRFVSFNSVNYQARIGFTNSQVEGLITNRYQYGQGALMALQFTKLRVKGKFNTQQGLAYLLPASPEDIVILSGQAPGVFKPVSEVPPTATPIPPSPTPAPTATPVPPPPPPTPMPSINFTFGNGSIVACLTTITTTDVVQACVNNAFPTKGSNVTVYGRLVIGGRPITGAVMTSIWNYKTTKSGCGDVTDRNGIASCPRDIGGATSDYEVRIDVSFSYAGKTYTTTTSFTPQ